MISSKDFVNKLNSYGFSRYLMVPCSIFKPLDNWMIKNNVDLLFPPNEAHAVGFAIGSYLVTKKPAVVFMQNSGLNNIANIQTSLNVLYKTPVILFVSWRGEPGKSDAPEHIEMGQITEKYLTDLKIPYVILSENWQEELDDIISISNDNSCPVAIIVRDGLFEKEEGCSASLEDEYPLSRMEAIKIIKDSLKDVSYVSTNGFISRDSFAVSQTPDFYMMGSMGHAFSLGIGVAAELKEKKLDRRVAIIDGDGGCLMHLGSLAMIGLDKLKESNLIYFILDNECYDSTGAQPTLSGIDFVKLAETFDFPQRYSVKTENDLNNVLNNLKPDLAALIHIKINRKSGGAAKRVSDVYTCEEIAKRFMDNF
jgi:phosphonopyruvate decarboxylase